MKPNYCLSCRKYDRCTEPKDCWVEAHLKRLERPRRKHHFQDKILYEHQLNNGPLHAYLNHTTGLSYDYAH